MIKNKFKLLSIILSILMLFSVSACEYSVNDSGNTPPQTQYYTVTFVYNNGETNSTVSVEKGKTVLEPASPQKNNYLFDGWYIVRWSEKYNFSIPITQDITLYANYKAVETYTVTLKYNNPDLIDKSFSVQKGKTFSTPSTPYKYNYIFEGWYTNESLTLKYDFSKPVTKNLTLYAKYKLDGTTITNKISTDLIKGVVKIYNKSYNTFLGLTTDGVFAQGSGFCFTISNNGYYYILTNCHVAKKVSGYDKQELIVEDYQGNQYEAFIYKNPNKSSSAIDPAYDLACLYIKTSSTNIKALSMGRVNPNIADDIIALGSPQGQTNSIGYGKVLAYQKVTINATEEESNVKFPVITHNAYTNPGSSGGPILDSTLSVVGVHYAGITDGNIKRAIPIEKVREFLNKYVYN